MNSRPHNLVWHQSTITREKRNLQNRHKSIILWFTGLPCSGKSTIAHGVEEQLFHREIRSFVLDGDNVRHGLSSNLGFSDEDRKENIRRIGEIAKIMMEAGIITITAFISPFSSERKKVRNLIAKGDFVEIFCNSSIATCETRDVKGLYKKARAGEIKNYTGIDSPYEEPVNPELLLNTGVESVQDSINKVIEFLETKKIIMS
jgi:adenylylsulfate kinase